MGSPAREQSARVVGLIRPVRWRLAVQAGRRFLAEWYSFAAFLAGWALVTWFVVALTSPVVWRLSGGLLLLSVPGWRHVLAVLIEGPEGVGKAGPNA